MDAKKTPEYFDVHAHLCDSEIYDSVLSGSFALPHTVISSGHSHESNLRTTRLKGLPNVYIGLGISPHEAIKDKDILAKLGLWMEYIESSKPDVISEIGLDHHWSKAEDEIAREKEVFRSMLSLAEKMERPVIVHSRKAEPDVISELLSYNIKKIVLHCFSGSVSDGARAVGNSMVISVPPVKSKSRAEVIKQVGLDNLVVETDYPYIGKQLSDIETSVAIISKALNMPIEDVMVAACKNAESLFSD